MTARPTAADLPTSLDAASDACTACRAISRADVKARADTPRNDTGCTTKTTTPPPPDAPLCSTKRRTAGLTAWA